MNVSFKVTGLDALQAQLDELGAEVAVRALARSARKAFEPVLEAAKSLVSADRGELREAISITTKKPSSGDAVVVVGLKIGKGAAVAGSVSPSSRWHFVEFGTAHMPAHPFLRPAMDQNAEKVLELLKTELEKSITRALKRKAAGK